MHMKSNRRIGQPVKAARDRNTFSQADSLLLPGENSEQFASFRNEIIVDLEPLGGLEETYVERMAMLMWRLRRVAQFEAALYRETSAKAHLFDFAGPFAPSFEELSEMSGSVVQSLLSEGLLEKLTRHEASLQRQLKETLNMLIGLQRRRSDRSTAECA